MSNNNRYSISPFRCYLDEIGYAKGTKAMIARYVQRFVSYKEPFSIASNTPEDIILFRCYLKTFPCNNITGCLSEKTIHDHIYSLRVFFNWLEITKQIDQNPISGIAFKQPNINTRFPLSFEQVQMLFDKASIKEKTVLHLLYSCGFRRSEAVALNLSDYYPQLNLVIVREGKGRKRRVVPVTDKVKNELSEYQRTAYRNYHTDEDIPFMVNERGNRMLGDSFDRLLKKVVQKTDIIKTVTPHVLRHSIATHLLDNGCNLEFVRDFLGHKYIDTTQIYTHIKGRLKV
jgi:integrase/recombinase XerD